MLGADDGLLGVRVPVIGRFLTAQFFAQAVGYIEHTFFLVRCAASPPLLPGVEGVNPPIAGPLHARLEITQGASYVDHFGLAVLRAIQCLLTLETIMWSLLTPLSGLTFSVHQVYHPHPLGSVLRTEFGPLPLIPVDSDFFAALRATKAHF